MDQQPDTPDATDDVTTAPGEANAAPGEANAALDAAWDRFVAHVADSANVIREDPRAEDPQIRAQGYKYLVNLTNAALEQQVFSADTRFPEHGHLQDSTKRYATESPDCLFGVSSVDPQGTYVIRATGGNPHYTGLTLYRDMDMYGAVQGAPPENYRQIFAAATGSTLGALAHPGGLTIDADGGWEVLVAATRPEDWDGDFLPLSADVNHVITRQYFYDWEREQAHHVSIERLDGPAGGPVDTPDHVTERLVGAGEQVEGMALFWRLLYNIKAKAKYNVLVTEPALAENYAGGSGGLIAYGGGFLEIQQDEAAIVEFTPPECHFWNFHLGDLWSQSLDYTWRQTHLNGHQATLDDEGVFRGVVSHVDPGVANWFDTAGNTRVHVTYRWWLMPHDQDVQPTVRIVKLADLDAELHPSTPRTTPAARAEALRVRRDAVLRRYQR